VTSMLTLALAAVVAGGALLWLVDASIRRTTVGVALILSLVVAESADVPLPNLNLGGVALYAGDLVFAVIATACVARHLRARRLARAHYWVIALGALTAYSLVRGVATFGPGAVSESRSWLLPVAAMVYAATAAPAAEILDRIGRFWAWAGSVLAVVAVGRWAALATGMGLGPILEPNVAGDIRVLGAPETLVIAQAFVILAPSWDSDGQPRDRIWAALLLGTVLLMLHRTVWVAVLGAILALFWRRPALGRRFGVGLVVIGTVATLAATMLLSANPDTLERRAANTDTFGWRLEGWQDLVFEQEPEKTTDWFVGRPFGTGYERTVRFQTRYESPHSVYVEGLLRVGLLGLAALTMTCLVTVWRLMRSPRDDAVDGLLSNDRLLSLAVFGLLYGITYGLEVTVFLGFGLALSATRRLPHAHGATEGIHAHPMRQRMRGVRA